MGEWGLWMGIVDGYYGWVLWMGLWLMAYGFGFGFGFGFGGVQAERLRAPLGAGGETGTGV